MKKVIKVDQAKISHEYKKMIQKEKLINAVNDAIEKNFDGRQVYIEITSYNIETVRSVASMFIDAGWFPYVEDYGHFLVLYTEPLGFWASINRKKLW